MSSTFDGTEEELEVGASEPEPVSLESLAPTVRTHRLPKEIDELFAIAKESGTSLVDLGKLFGVSPAAVRDAIERVPEDQLRAIRRMFGMLTWVKAREIVDGLQDEMLRRIRGGELSEHDDHGRPLVTFGVLADVLAKSSALPAVSALEAGMVAESERAPQNSLARLLLSSTELAEAIKLVPAGERVRIEIGASVEVNGQAAGSTALPASAEVVDDGG